MKTLLIGSLFFLLSSFQLHAKNLILVIDMSLSISDHSRELQINGYIDALTRMRHLDTFHIDVILFANKYAHISSGNREEAIIALEENRDWQGFTTCLTDVLEYVHYISLQYDDFPVIDISGDGEDNCRKAGSVYDVLDKLDKLDAQINTLYIGKDEDSLNFYRSLVRGFGFSINVEYFRDFEFAIYEKLVLETSQIAIDYNSRIK